jgi:hypothetical protein
MTTDNKTLADVQPGGRVRLGDQAERARFEQYRGGDFERDAHGYYTNPRTAQDWAMWQAALSAQPSPGGQDAREIIEEFLQCAASGRPHGKLIAQAKDYLAARQPVYAQGCDELRARTEGERAAYREGLEEGKKFAARQPVGEP